MLRNFLFKLFEMSHFDTGISLTAFSIPHFVYLALIIGSIVLTWCLMKNKPYEKKVRLLSIIAISILVSYVSDFFFHDFVYAEVLEDGTISGGGLNMDKLPFHICTVLCPIILTVQFNKKLRRFIEPVAMLASVAPIMYLGYPASVGTGEPWCYQTVQTMFYHGAIMAWGILNLSLGVVKPSIKKCWQAGVLLSGITLWAKLGNLAFGDFNWFFLEEDAFYIGLVSGGIIPKWSLMIFNPIIFFAGVMGVYGTYYLVITLKARIAEHRADAERRQARKEKAEAAQSSLLLHK